MGKADKLGPNAKIAIKAFLKRPEPGGNSTIGFADDDENQPVVRQTFIIGSAYLDKIKDFVYTKRRSGLFEYSQKDALHDALDLLFAQTKISKRPAEIRAKEEKRNMKIRESKR